MFENPRINMATCSDTPPQSNESQEHMWPGSKPKCGDVHYCGDYKYKYFSYSGTPSDTWFEEYDKLFNGNVNRGWIVELTTDKDKEEYGEILSEVGGEPIVSADRLFSGCKKIKYSPTLPKTITSMNSTFENCYSLLISPEIPSSVIEMNDCYLNCHKLTDPPIIPHKVNSMIRCFAGCNHLTKAPFVPSTVETIWMAFRDCYNLTNWPSFADNSLFLEKSTMHSCCMIHVPSQLNVPSIKIVDCCKTTQGEHFGTAIIDGVEISFVRRGKDMKNIEIELSRDEWLDEYGNINGYTTQQIIILCSSLQKLADKINEYIVDHPHLPIYPTKQLNNDKLLI